MRSLSAALKSRLPEHRIEEYRGFRGAEFVGRIESGGGVGCGSELRLGAVDKSLPGMRRVLRFGGGHVLKALKSACDVAGHGDIARTAVVIPGEG